jgi:Peptidase family M28
MLAPEETQLLGRLKGAEMWRWVQRLSASEYDGRRAGTAGAVRTVEILAAQFARIGLEQPTSAEGYRQPFTMSYSLLRSPWDRRATLADSRAGVKLQLEYPDFVPSACSIAGQAVSLGYGIYRPDRRWDDYQGVSLRGKVAVFWQGEPAGVSQSIEARCRTARERGALGCLVIARTPLQESADGMKDRGVSGLVADRGLTAAFPILQLRRETAARLFGRPVPVPQLSAARLAALRRSAPPDPLAKRLGPTPAPSRESGAGSPEHVALGRISLRIPACVDPARPLANVVGALTGSDKTLRDQWLLFSAHLDHLGRTGSALYGGADDDASGVAVVCAVAEAIARMPTRPRRSILFALWNGEECGLLGSRHYVDRPLVPLEQTVGVLQLDMVGVGRSNAFLTSSRRPPVPSRAGARGRVRAFELFENAAHPLHLGLLSDGVTGISDHIPFVRAGVPAIVITTAGVHPNYHSVGDRAELVQPQALENCARLMALSVWRIANDTGAPPAIAANPRVGRPIR